MELGKRLQRLELVEMEVNYMGGGGSFAGVQEIQGDLGGERLTAFATEHEEEGGELGTRLEKTKCVIHLMLKGFEFAVMLLNCPLFA